jgi:hypothetical protein
MSRRPVSDPARRDLLPLLDRVCGRCRSGGYNISGSPAGSLGSVWSGRSGVLMPTAFPPMAKPNAGAALRLPLFPARSYYVTVTICVRPGDYSSDLINTTNTG